MLLGLKEHLPVTAAQLNKWLVVHQNFAGLQSQSRKEGQCMQTEIAESEFQEHFRSMGNVGSWSAKDGSGSSVPLSSCCARDYINSMMRAQDSGL